MTELGLYQSQNFLNEQTPQDLKYNQLPSPFSNQRQLKMNKIRVINKYQNNPYNSGGTKIKVNESMQYAQGNMNSNRKQNSNSPFRLINSNSNRNNVQVRDSQLGVQNDQEILQNGLENNGQIKQTAQFYTQKTSPRITNKGNNTKYQSKLHDIFHLYNINLQSQQFPQYQMQLQQNKYQHRVNVQSSLGSNNYSTTASLNQNYANINQNTYDPQIQNHTTQQDLQQYKQSLEQITESGVESTNPTQANIPLISPDFEKIEKREKVPSNIQQMIIKQQIKTRSSSRKKGRNIASSSLGKQQKLIYIPYAQKPPTTQPSSNRYIQNLNINNLVSNYSQKNNRVVRYQTEINYTDNGLDKSTQNMSCLNTRIKTPDQLQQRRDSMESIVMGQEQISNTSQIIHTNNSILNTNQNMNTIKSLGGQPQTINNINSSQILNQNSANQSFNTISINQNPNSLNNSPQRIRGYTKYQNPSIIKFNNNNSNNSLVYQNDQSPIQHYNEGICFNSQTNMFLPSHRSERNDTSPISCNNLGGMSGSNASCRTPQTQISGMTPINSTKNYHFSQPHSNNHDKPKSALSFYKVKSINQQETVKRNQMTMDQFQILDTLGKGSYAQVKLAIDKRTNQKIAIKIYEKFKLTDPNKFKNVRREINILSKMTHENIIRLYHVIDTVSSLNLVMEYIGNNSLYNYLRAKRKNQLEMNQIRKIFIQIISGIQYMHNKNVCHRDIKLENILIDDDLNLKIIDFGFAVVSPIERKLDSFCGTPSYMSPEIVLKKEYIGQYVDIWTCGIVLYILICGKFPFKGADEKELYRKISKHQYEIPSFVERGARSLIQRLLSFNPEDRPSCLEILKDKWLTSFDETVNCNEQQITVQNQQDEEIILEQKEDSVNTKQKSNNQD
ncbi:Serine/Threonine kinase domain protein (macronuclear) [Tetrahymena thermophila SB210]|uniref:Serine/Threonine kinase domain protein n=1 Tax=Tetrahymena thermophila (strain SB210) TaxID=312017 RepID=I7MI42_TETTS|nr:Serine/Threonine kinase domain protein [Tetrahymena thermophila SB210]EAR90856.2 Serine/Threonine kinase domain protein [Tetrahymena thermophila SB210]|eukprot:XP_001011101.2 Serine/Threonine kinase domain protein [Tetrahymena thermophila SB210]